MFPPIALDCCTLIARNSSLKFWIFYFVAKVSAIGSTSMIWSRNLAMVHSVKSCWHSIDWRKKNSPWKWSLSPHSMLNDSLKWLARSNCKPAAKTVQTSLGSRSSLLWKIWSALSWKTWREAISSSTLRKGNSNQFPSKCQGTSCHKYVKPSNTYINTGLSIEISN